MRDDRQGFDKVGMSLQLEFEFPSLLSQHATPLYRHSLMGGGLLYRRLRRLTVASHTRTVLSHDAVNKANQLPVSQTATDVTGP